MKDYIVLFREPDGREDIHTEEETRAHRGHWADWFARWGKEGRLAGGDALTLEGRLITGDGSTIADTPHRVGKEIVGGFLLIKAVDLDEAARIMASCPIYEAGGYAEVRDLMT